MSAAVLAALLPAGPALSTSDDDSIPDVRDAVRAFSHVRDWTDQLAAPLMEADAARVSIDGATGVCIILRRAGRAVGAGIDTGGDPLMLRRAFGRAISDLAGDPAFRSLDDDVKNAIGPKLLVEIEFAGTLRPMAGRSFAQLAEQIRPGLDGVALRRGDSRAMSFPSVLATRNAHGGDPRTIFPLIAELGLEATEFGDLVQRHRVSAYRFATMHLVQTQTDEPPFRAYRGRRIVDSPDVTTQSLKSLTDQLVAHITNRTQTADNFDDDIRAATPDLARGRMLAGDYNAALDRFAPAFASPMDTALTAFALARHAAYTANPDTRAECAQLAARLLNDLKGPRSIGGQPVVPIDTAPVAAVIMTAYLELDRDGLAGSVDRAFVDQAADRVRMAFDPAKASFSHVLADGVRNTSVDPHGQAVIAMALSFMAGRPGSDVPSSTARRAIDAAWASVPEAEHVQLLPWIGWAEQAWHDRHAPLDADSEAATRSRLQLVIDALDAARVSTFDAPDEPDIVGGFNLSTDSRARPTAQTVRPAAFVASALRDPWLMPRSKRVIATARHMQTMRFVMQLTVRDDLADRLRNRRIARGGLCNALWDYTQPTAAQAMALLCLTETVRSLEAATANRP